MVKNFAKPIDKRLRTRYNGVMKATFIGKNSTFFPIGLAFCSTLRYSVFIM